MNILIGNEVILQVAAHFSSMSYAATYPSEEPTRAEVEGWQGKVVVEFGAAWCPICQAAQGALRAALESAPTVRHVKIEDGKGKPLGRSFGVKLWPNLVLLRNGRMVEQLARPTNEEISQAVAGLAGE